MADGLVAAVTELLADRPASMANQLAEAVRRHCTVEHVALVSFEGTDCSILAAAGLDLLAVGTTAPVALSTRLVRALECKPWSSPDLAREQAFERPIDQLAAALGIRSGASVPICSAGQAIGAVLLSSTSAGRSWADEIARVDAVTGLIALGLGIGREPGEPLRVVVVHRDPLTAHGLARVVERGLPAQVSRGAGTVVPRRAALTELIPAVARAVGRPDPPWPTSSAVTLTSRERELLLELSTGSTYKQIATRLGLSTATVRGYSRNLYAKLDVHSRGEAVHKATQAGLTAH
jgi:DNA-binding CsgD family transcriptional regulator